jgi:uroporphyrinogen-III synthase
MRILVTRPLEDGQQVAARLAAMGHQALLAPLLEPRWRDGPQPDFAGVQAILATSANGIRALARRMHRPASPFSAERGKGEVAFASEAKPSGSEGRRGFDIPVFAVGPQTAEEARRAGFSLVRNADGDARALAAAVPDWADPGKGTLLHVCGEEAPGLLGDALRAQGFDVRRAALYAVEAARALPPAAVKALSENVLDGALFFSPRSAQVFCDLAAGLPIQNLTAFCISPATASALPPRAFARTAVAGAPNQDALLALLA